MRAILLLLIACACFGADATAPRTLTMTIPVDVGATMCVPVGIIQADGSVNPFTPADAAVLLEIVGPGKASRVVLPTASQLQDEIDALKAEIATEKAMIETCQKQLAEAPQSGQRGSVVWVGGKNCEGESFIPPAGFRCITPDGAVLDPAEQEATERFAEYQRILLQTGNGQITSTGSAVYTLFVDGGSATFVVPVAP